MAKRSPLAVRAQLLLGLVSLIAFVYLWAAERRRTIGPVSEDLRKTFSSTASQPTTNTNCKFTMITIATSGREYRRLHRLLTNRQRYARRHGYEWQLHLDAVYPPDPMWSKIPAIELALFGHSEIPGLDYPGESYEDLLSEKIDHVEDTDDTSSPEHWAWWFDTDAFITNQNVELAAIVDRAKEVHKSSFPDGQKAPPLDLILSRDCNGLNAGSYLVRKSAWSRRYLHAIWMLKSEIHNIDPDRTSEQDAMAFLLHNSPDVQKRAVFAPQKVINGNAPEIKCTELLANGEDGPTWEEGDFTIHIAGSWAHKANILERNGISAKNRNLDEFDAETFLLDKYWPLIEW